MTALKSGEDFPQNRHGESQVKSRHPLQQSEAAIMLNELALNSGKPCLMLSNCFGRITGLRLIRPSGYKRVVQLDNHSAHGSSFRKWNASNLHAAPKLRYHSPVTLKDVMVLENTFGQAENRTR